MKKRIIAFGGVILISFFTTFAFAKPVGDETISKEEIIEKAAIFLKAVQLDAPTVAIKTLDGKIRTWREPRANDVVYVYGDNYFAIYSFDKNEIIAGQASGDLGAAAGTLVR